MLKAVIFDMDGVIIDSEAIHVEATLKVLNQYNITPPVDYLNQFVGRTVQYTFEQIRKDFHITDTLDHLLQLDCQITKDIYALRGMIPVPDVIPFIKSLHKDGIRMVIASSSSRKRIEEVTKTFGIDSYFEDFISGTELINSKPAPDIFLKALRVLNIKPNEAIVIEDSKNGCLASKAANIACIGYINPNSGNQDLYSATVAIESFASIDTTYLNEICLRANGEPVTIAKTKRLIIRELSSSDTDCFLQLYEDEEVANFNNFIDGNSKDKAEKLNSYIKTIYPFYGFGLWGIFRKDTCELIGCCGIQNQMINENQEIELSYMLGKQYWGNGYALEACRNVLRIAESRFGIDRIVAAIDSKNKRSIHLAEKLGMTLETTVFYHNRTCNLYSIDLASRRLLESRNQVVNKYSKSPDTSVYSKRFSHKLNKKTFAN